MAEMIADGVLLPTALLALFGWLLPKLLSMVLPEGVWPLLLNGVLSALGMVVLGTVMFVWLYVSRGMPLAELLGPDWSYAIWFFGKLGLGAALIWGPIMLLSLAGLPRTWRTAIW